MSDNTDIRDLLGMDKDRFLSDGDAVMEHRPRYRYVPYTDPRIDDAPPPPFDPGPDWEEALIGYDAEGDLDMFGKVPA